MAAVGAEVLHARLFAAACRMHINPYPELQFSQASLSDCITSLSGNISMSIGKHRLYL
jgi:hypothetical protein